MLRFLLTFYISPLNELVGMQHNHLPCSAASRNCLDNSTLNRDIVRKCGKANSTVGQLFTNLKISKILDRIYSFHPFPSYAHSTRLSTAEMAAAIYESLDEIGRLMLSLEK